MNPLDWILWSSMCGAGSGILVYFIMQSRTEVLLSRQREDLAAARAALRAQEESLENSLKGVEEATRRKVLEEFMAEIRVEERYYVREQKALSVTRRSNIRQERTFFRNIPLSSWLEYEMSSEEISHPETFAQNVAISPSEDTRAAIKQLPLGLE